MRRRTILRLLLATIFFAAPAHMTHALLPQQTQVQTAPVTEPRGQEDRTPRVAKGAAAIAQKHDGCRTRLIVSADALFRPHRWTLNPDAVQTLDELGPMVAKAGTPAARVLAYTAAAAEGQDENRDVAQRRAATVRTWLVNHQFLPQGTPAEASEAEAQDLSRTQKNGTVAIVIDTCAKPDGR